MAFNDFRDIIRQMEREMFSDDTFRGFFALPAGGTGRFWQPAVDIHETDESVRVKVELAGVKADDLQVSLTPDDRVLNISGTRGESGGEREGRTRCHGLEIYFGPFERAVGLPSGLRLDRDAIRATYKDGFLQVTLPKRRAPEPKTRLIPINSETSAGASAETKQSTDTENED